MNDKDYTLWGTKKTISERPLQILLAGPSLGAAAGAALGITIGLALVATAVIAFPVVPFICAGVAIIGAIIGLLAALKNVKNKHRMYHPMAKPTNENPWDDHDEEIFSLKK